MSGFIEFKVATKSRSVPTSDCELLLNGKFTTLASKVQQFQNLLVFWSNFQKRIYLSRYLKLFLMRFYYYSGAFALLMIDIISLLDGSLILNKSLLFNN